MVRQGAADRRPRTATIGPSSHKLCVPKLAGVRHLHVRAQHRLQPCAFHVLGGGNLQGQRHAPGVEVCSNDSSQ